jgi:hypothetical protein
LGFGFRRLSFAVSLRIRTVNFSGRTVQILYYAALLVGLHPSLDDQCRRKDALVKGVRRVHHHSMESRGVGEQLSDRLKPSQVSNDVHFSRDRAV